MDAKTVNELELALVHAIAEGKLDADQANKVLCTFARFEERVLDKTHQAGREDVHTN